MAVLGRTQGTVLIHSAAELEGYSRGEEDRLESLIKGIADSGARVVVAGSAIGEMALHFIEKFGMMALRIPSKFDLRRFCRCVTLMFMDCRSCSIVCIYRPSVP